MIQTASTLSLPTRLVVQTPRAVLQASEHLRDEAALVLADALDGATGKQMDRAAVPTCGRYAISRAMNGGDSNPLYRIAALLLLMKRMGMGRERALRILDWLREVIDAIWPEAEAGDLQKVLERDQELDVKDDTLRLRAALGCREAQGELLLVKRRLHAHGPIVISALRQAVQQG